ncbi:hypothetical protein CY34DRAFT_328292 [Suillus luteus UH-Slu-Lm8-n1]|uniref:Uncharacterized protein n=1 Tax=Suillus luteus UH-Slu-Lm8-n1 TaxID=930992 RepID=A0A0D0B6S8_9AGAM|nr:hypothetical protein CY34DRAFT_328292 [Suillus luteus UH-Slu-Lm8-n1]
MRCVCRSTNISPHITMICSNFHPYVMITPFISDTIIRTLIQTGSRVCDIIPAHWTLGSDHFVCIAAPMMPRLAHSGVLFSFTLIVKLLWFLTYHLVLDIALDAS